MLNAVCRQKYESFVVVSVQVSRSASLNGPWSEPVGPLVERGGAKLLLLAPRHLLLIASQYANCHTSIQGIDQWDYIVTNPAPVFLPNGRPPFRYLHTDASFV